MRSNVESDKTDMPEPIAERFRALRRKAHITQAQLGDILDICRQAVNEIENSRVMPHYSTADRFSDLEARHERERSVGESLLQPLWR